MEKIIAGRHFDVSDNHKKMILHELDKFEDEYHKLTSIRVVLDVQRNWHFTEIIIHGKNITIEAKAKSKQRNMAISNAVDKARRQLRKHLDKVKSHHVNRRPVEIDQ